MTTVPYEVLLRIRNGQPFAQVRTLTTVGNREIEDDPTPLNLAGDDFAEFKTAFNAATLTQLQAANAQVAELTAERDSLANEVASLTEQLAEFMSVNPRIIFPYEFLGRFTTAERISTLQRAQSDMQVALILSELQTVQRVHLDSQQTQQAIGYLASIGVLAQSRVAEVLA